MNKKILFIITQSEFGGAQRFLLNLTTRLDKNKYEIIVASGPRGDDRKGLLSFLSKEGINVKRLKYLKRSINPFFDFLGLLELKRLIKKEKPDTLFLCSSKAGFLGSLVSQGSKVIYRIGGWAFNDPRSSLSKVLYKGIERLSARWKDIIIVNSEHDLEQAKELKIKPKNKIVNIYNGVDVDNLKFLSREKARDFLNIKDSDFIVGTIANDYPAKGLKYLKQAAASIRGEPRSDESERENKYKFVIIGKGNRFIPEAYKYLKAFDIFVLPSVKEGFPWVVLEAMAAGLPIIATRVGAVPEILEHKKTAVLIQPGRVEELTKAISDLADNRELRDKISSQGERLVAEKFSLNKMVKKIEELL